MLKSLGATDFGPLSRSRLFASSTQTPAQCAESAIAMPIIPIQGEAGCGADHHDISRRS